MYCDVALRASHITLLGGTAVSVGFLIAIFEWLTPSRQGEVKKGMCVLGV
jgi:hypothetical protein